MRRLLVLALPLTLLLALSACGDDGGGSEAAPSLIVGQESVDGELTDNLIVVNPDEEGTETIEVPDLGSGIPAGPGKALYESGSDIVLVDVVSGDVDDLGLSTDDVDLAYSLVSDTAGDRFMLLLSPVGSGGALVDLESGEVTDLLDAVGGDGGLASAELAGDQSMVLVNTDESVFLVDTADPDTVQALGEGFGQLIGDGTSVLLRGPEGIAVVGADGAEPTVLSEDSEVTGIVVGDRVLLGVGEDAQLVDPDSGEVLVSVPLGEDPGGTVVVGDNVLVSAAPDNDGAWTLIDGAAATATPVPDLEGRTPSYIGRPSRWVPFEETAGLVGALAGVDAEAGTVQPVDALAENEVVVGYPSLSGDGPWTIVPTELGGVPHTELVDLATGETHDLGPRLQGATLSPDGEQVAWSAGDAPDLSVGPVDDPEAGEVIADGLALPLWLPAS